MSRRAETSQPILETLATRWSPRSFDASVEIDDAAVTAMLEAARWSPSSSNSQPWRFIVTRRGTANFEQVFESLGGFNRDWAGNASLLVVALYDTTFAAERHTRWAQYDLGQAVSHLVTQVHAMGYFAHQMGGFQAATIEERFELPDGVHPLTLIAVGSLAAPEALPETLRERELAPRSRKPLEELVLLRDWQLETEADAPGV